jgi:hypothetical protein
LPLLADFGSARSIFFERLRRRSHGITVSDSVGVEFGIRQHFRIRIRICIRIDTRIHIRNPIQVQVGIRIEHTVNVTICNLKNHMG